MKASNMIKKMSSRILTAVMAVSLAMPLQVCARTLDDNPAGETVSIGAGDTMINNWGHISSNQGTLQNNAGTVTSNSGTIDNNYGRIINNAGGNVGINHTGGYVNTSTGASGGTVADNYGNVSNAIVENNYASGTVTGDGSEITNNWGNATNVHLVVYNCGTVTTNNNPERFVEVNYAGGSVDGVAGEGDGPVAENPTDPNPNAPEQEKPKENSLVTMIKTEICKQIPALLLTNAPSIVLDMNGSTNLSNEMLKAMFDVFDELGYGKPVDCVFYIDGKKVVLRIPMDENVLQNTASILKALAGENNGVAGPDRLVELFANYGFSIIEDKRIHLVTVNSLVRITYDGRSQVFGGLLTGEPGGRLGRADDGHSQVFGGLLTGETGGPSVASINPNPDIGIDPAISQATYDVSGVINLIGSTPPGGTVEFTTNDSAFLDDPSVVNALMARRDISVKLNVTVNGVIYVIFIPAGADLRRIVNITGGIDLSALIALSF